MIKHVDVKKSDIGKHNILTENSCWIDVRTGVRYFISEKIDDNKYEAVKFNEANESISVFLTTEKIESNKYSIPIDVVWDEQIIEVT